MGIPGLTDILDGKPLHPVPRDAASSPGSLAVWIRGESPCVVGAIPVKFTVAIESVLAKHYPRVPAATIDAAFRILENEGMRFERGGIDVRRFDPRFRQGPQMYSVTKAEAERMTAFTFEEYERRYEWAIRTNNTNDAEQILVAVLELLWSATKSYAKAKAPNVKMIEWEEFNRAVDESLDRARMLQTHCRQLTRDELKSLRDAPTSAGFRSLAIRFASRITTRTASPSRRVRR